jgi:hypothetical protein
VIHTNQKHPFFTIEHGFLPVGQIKLGMHLLRADGRVGVVSGWKVVPGTKTMYNLEVAQDHTFTVGAGQWVVHNSGGECGDPSGPSDLRGQLRKSGAKFTEENVVGITRTAEDSSLVWLETGDSSAGLTHIMESHADQFAQLGVVGEENVANLILDTLSNEIPIGTVRDARIFSVPFDDVEHELAIVVGNNGFIVTAYPFTP